MAVLLHKKIENVRYLFGSPETSQSRFNQIKRTFEESKMYQLFSEPVYSQPTSTIIWSTEHEGTFVSYQKLSPTDQMVAQKLLTASIQNILNAAKQYNDNTLIDFIYQCIEIPSMDNVYLVRGKAGDKVVITQWGFISDAAGDERGLLAKIIAVKRVDVSFTVVYEDNKNEPAQGQKFFFEFEGQTQAQISDNEGKINLKEVRVDDQIIVYQKNGENKTLEQSFYCYENGKYVLEVPRLIDMNFIVINQHEQPVAGQAFTFNIEGTETTLTSDASGKIILPKIKFGQSVDAYQLKENQKTNEQSFVCQKDPNEKYYLKVVVEEVKPPVIEPPKEEKYKMQVKVLDPENNIVPNAKVTLKYLGKTVEKVTDENGYVYLDDVKPNTKVEVKAIADNKK